MAGIIVYPTSTTIRSIQSGTIQINNAATSQTATLPTSVNTAKAAVFFNGQQNASSTAAVDIGVYVALTNATTVTATRQGNTNAVIVAYTVVEYN